MPSKSSLSARTIPLNLGQPTSASPPAPTFFPCIPPVFTRAARTVSHLPSTVVVSFHPIPVPVPRSSSAAQRASLHAPPQTPVPPRSTVQTSLSQEAFPSRSRAPPAPSPTSSRSSL